jgi:catechol 2,3-dioxygenase-like lactoylglutathione lyase family enzyme
MINKLTHVGIWVTDLGEAKDFYVEKLGFVVRTDDSNTIPGYRWLTVAPPQQTDVEIILSLAMDAGQTAQLGKQGTWVLSTDNVREDYRRLKAGGVKTHYEPRENPYGTDFVFEDLYGNTYDLVQTPSR